MKDERTNSRIAEADVDEMFIERWSPRAFIDEPIEPGRIKALFEAARWAPSCYNEQPWRFYYAAAPESREKFLSVLVEKNQKWARKAPLLILLAANKTFTDGGRENPWADFDAGAAWMSLALQARKMDLYAHAMAGFDRNGACEILGLDAEEYHVLAAIAVGRRGSVSDLPEEFREMEAPNDRKALDDIIRQAGCF